MERKHSLVCAALLLGGAFLHWVLLGAFVPMLVLANVLWGLVLIAFVAVSGARAWQERWRAVEEQLAESERRGSRAERERDEVQRLVQLERLLVGLAHEVNNPLAFVKSNLDFVEHELRREGGPENQAELFESLDEIRRGLLRIREVVSGLLRYAHETEAEKEVGLLEDAMQKVKQLASLRLKSPSEAVVDVPPGLPPVRLRHQHLVEILMNLLMNAANAVEAAVPPRPAHIVVRARRVAGGVRMEVEDNGPGIPPEQLHRLFEPFFSHRSPTGLPLYRQYATRVGGSLHAENIPEGGTRFVLVLPEAPAQQL
jgi:signal transduction histidine kinase